MTLWCVCELKIGQQRRDYFTKSAWGGVGSIIRNISIAGGKEASSMCATDLPLGRAPSVRHFADAVSCSTLFSPPNVLYVCMHTHTDTTKS